MDNFLETNNLGGYLWYYKKPFSRYQGWFLVFKGRMMKLIDSIEGGFESITFPRFSNTLIIENRQDTRTIINFDIRESYQTPQWNRIYAISKKDGIWWIHYNIEPIVVGIKVQGIAKTIGEWIEKRYSFDKERNSPPFLLWVYQGIEIKAKRIIIAAGESEQEVLDQLKKVTSYKLPACAEALAGRQATSSKNAYELARESLLSLRVYDNKRNILGVYAGLPWFFQFWLRDSAVSYRALSFFEPQEARFLLSQRMHLLHKSHPAYVDLQGKPFGLGSIDGPLWIQFRAKEFGIHDFLEEHQNIDFITNNKKETWMDTIPREGTRIEVQVLKLSLIHI